MSSASRDFERELTIGTPASEVYAALTTLEGLAGWWTPLVEGDPTVGGELIFRFKGLDEQIVMRVEDARPTERLAWTCLEHSGHPEWEGTDIVFELEDRDDGSLLALRHHGLTPALDCYEVCESGWEGFLASISGYAETGTGTPYGGARS